MIWYDCRRTVNLCFLEVVSETIFLRPQPALLRSRGALLVLLVGVLALGGDARCAGQTTSAGSASPETPATRTAAGNIPRKNVHAFTATPVTTLPQRRARAANCVRARYAVTLGHLERSNCSGLLQLSTVNA